ncbi:hypothetical protein L1987_70809 [Smallanthus sonchifolius]|uniref:Uncharacterized protein n=1 Tax=Smallanthus sonchifolius TaxID=185202 RepID=A0ACB9AR07_9ASTR|nr:hypothetical protein L1987_70809 [Smallanthus sonchifolius]
MPTPKTLIEDGLGGRSMIGHGFGGSGLLFAFATERRKGGCGRSFSSNDNETKKKKWMTYYQRRFHSHFLSLS